MAFRRGLKWLGAPTCRLDVGGGGGEEETAWGNEDDGQAMDGAGAAAQDGDVAAQELEASAGGEEPVLAGPDAAPAQEALQRPTKRGRPKSGNQRLKREFRSRKSLAGAGGMPQRHAHMLHACTGCCLAPKVAMIEPAAVLCNLGTAGTKHMGPEPMSALHGVVLGWPA